MITMQELLKRAIDLQASDLHLTAGAPPLYRIDGSLVRTNTDNLTPDQVLKLGYSVMTDQQRKHFEQNSEVDFSFGVQNLGRYRANVYLQRGCAKIGRASCRERV
jgi:twitching motility protein PilT